MGADDAAAAADTLTAVGILAGGRPLAFAHPMMREGLYGELSAAERARAHREAARLLHDAGRRARARRGAPAGRGAGG